MMNLVNVIRQNHALEHATMHVLGDQNPYLRLVGRSTPSGFIIYGQIDTQKVASAVTEALVRLQQGESHLAVHPRCGTNLAVTSILVGSAAFAATLGHPRSKLDRWPVAIAAATLAAMVAAPLGHRIQEQITTSAEVDGLYIADVTRQERGTFVIHRITVGRE